VERGERSVRRLSEKWANGTCDPKDESGSFYRAPMDPGQRAAVAFMDQPEALACSRILQLRKRRIVPTALRFNVFAASIASAVASPGEFWHAGDRGGRADLRGSPRRDPRRDECAAKSCWWRVAKRHGIQKKKKKNKKTISVPPW
jgi:hypothetical protein